MIQAYYYLFDGVTVGIEIRPIGSEQKCKMAGWILWNIQIGAMLL